jgi:tRNA(Ile)-lysidine synthase
VPAAERDGAPIIASELSALFAEFSYFKRVLLAISGGPDSTALLVLAARWREKGGVGLVAATVDHRLRRESNAEAGAVATLANKLGIEHHMLVWSGRKPSTGLQAAARAARYGLLTALARKIGADAIVTAHTRDDQAETVLHRLARGSGLAGLAGIRKKSERDGIVLLRPLLDVPKARLVATLRAANIPFAEDPTNRDPRYLRTRVRALAPQLAAEGLDAVRLAGVARRLGRANAAIEAAVCEAKGRVARGAWPKKGPVELDAASLFALPAEVGIRLLGGAVTAAGDEGRVELAKLETLYEELAAAQAANRRLKRTLGGAAAALAGPHLSVSRAPARRGRKAVREH